MSVFNLTADDTLTLYGRIFNDFADDDVAALTFPNDIMKPKTGKNKNTIFAKDETGSNGTLVLRLMLGSSDDKFLNGILVQSSKDFPSTRLANGEMVKRVGDGDGNVGRVVYTLLGGMISKNVEVKENVSGDTSQSVAIYTIMFAEVKRSMQ